MHTGCLTLFGGLSRSTIRASARTETVVSMLLAWKLMDCISLFLAYGQNRFVLTFHEVLPFLPSGSRYRVVAIDHDLFSFSDLKFEQWPAVLITNPKDAQYLHPRVEPLGRIRRSTHIRLVVLHHRSPVPSAAHPDAGHLLPVTQLDYSFWIRMQES